MRRLISDCLWIAGRLTHALGNAMWDASDVVAGRPLAGADMPQYVDRDEPVE